MGRLTRNSPPTLLPDWRQREAWRKSQGAGAFAGGSLPAEDTPPQKQGASTRMLLCTIGASGLGKTSHRDAEFAESSQTPRSPRDPRAPIGTRS